MILKSHALHHISIITVLSCILHVCNWLCTGRIWLGWTHDALSFACHMFMHFSCICSLLFNILVIFELFWSFFNCSFFPLSILFTLVVSMTPKRKSTLEDDNDGDTSSTDEMSTWHFYPLSLVTKRESSFDMRVAILRGRVSIGLFVRRSVDMRDVVSITCIFSSFYRYIVLVH